MTAKRTLGATLKDVHSPAALFWHLASPSLLPLPKNAPSWHPADPDDVGWLPVATTELCVYSALKRRVETSPDLLALIELADRLGPEGRTALTRLLSRRLDQTPRPSPSEVLKAG